jgi:4-azaleucine resistance transporter AzlC
LTAESSSGILQTFSSTVLSTVPWYCENTRKNEEAALFSPHEERGLCAENLMNRATLSSTSRTKPPLVSAFRQTLPIILGYVPVGFAYGVLAQKSGLSGMNTILMSALVYAGSAQLIAVGLFAGGVAPLAIVATTFVVNLRHLLMSAALAHYLRAWDTTHLALFSYQMTDETFALHANRFAKSQTCPAETFGINIIAQSAWVGSTALGLAASTLIKDIRPIGLDYAHVHRPAPGTIQVAAAPRRGHRCGSPFHRPHARGP